MNISANDKATQRVVTILSFAAFASSATVRICDPLLPIIAETFGVTTGQAASVITATNVGYGISLLAVGPLGDHLGKFRAITFACFICALAAMGSTLSVSLGWLIVTRVITGAVTAALIPLSMAWIGDVVQIEERQNTLAKFMTGQIIGLVTGQAIGGYFADTLGWHSSFAFLSIVYGSVGLLMVTYSNTAKALSSTADESSVEKLPIIVSLRLLATTKNSIVVLTTVFFESMGVFGALAFIPSYVHEQYNVSLFIAGSVVATFGLGGLCYARFARLWIRKLGQPGLILCAGNILGLAFLLIYFGNNILWTVAGSTLAGFGFYMQHVTLQAEATQMLPQARGTAVSIFASSFFLGQATGVSIAAYFLTNLDASYIFLSSTIMLPLVAFSFREHLIKRQKYT